MSVLSKERRYNFLSKCVRESDKFDPDKVYATFKYLMRVVEEEYVRQMKKCIVLKEMQDPLNHQKFLKLKIPVRLPKRTAPYFAVVKFKREGYLVSKEGVYPITFPPGTRENDFKRKTDDIRREHYSADSDLVGMTKIFTKKCIDFQEFRFMNTNKQILKLPRELTEL